VLIIFAASLFLFSLCISTIFAFPRDSSKQPKQQTKKKGDPPCLKKGKNRVSIVTNTITPLKHGHKSSAFSYD
jgi:hypothetical protein